MILPDGSSTNPSSLTDSRDRGDRRSLGTEGDAGRSAGDERVHIRGHAQRGRGDRGQRCPSLDLQPAAPPLCSRTFLASTSEPPPCRSWVLRRGARCLERGAERDPSSRFSASRAGSRRSTSTEVVNRRLRRPLRRSESRPMSKRRSEAFIRPARACGGSRSRTSAEITTGISPPWAEEAIRPEETVLRAVEAEQAEAEGAEGRR